MSFNLTGPTSITVNQGESASAIYRAVRLAKPYRNVSFSVTSLPPGIAATFTPVSCTPTCQATLKLTASPSSAVGTFTITITARDSKSSKSMPVVLSNYSVNMPPSATVGFTADVWVAKAADGGSDSNDGLAEFDTGSAGPKLTIGAGLVVLNSFGNNASKVMAIKAGTYVERIDNTVNSIPNGSSFSNAATIRAYPGHVVTLQPSSGVNPVLHMGDGASQYVIFRDLVLNGINGMEEIVSLRGPSHHIRVLGCDIKNTQGPNNAGLTSYPGTGTSGSNEIISCLVHDNGTSSVGPSGPAPHGLYIATNNNLIEGCQIYNNRQHGMQIFETPTPSNCIVRNNIIHHNGRDTGLYNVGLVIYGDGHLVYNNIIYDERDEGLYIESASSCKIFHNSLYATGSGINFISGGSSTAIKNNLLYNVTTLSNGGGATLANNLQPGSDPYVNSAGANFHLAANDNGGANLTADVPTDFDGVTRTTTPDRGAYEFVA